MFTTRPEIAGSFGVVASTHWIASQVGMARAGAGRQRLRRGGRGRLHAAGRGAAPERPGRRRADHPARRQVGRAARDLRPGRRRRPGCPSAHVRDELGLDLVPGTGLLPAMVPGAFDAWALMLRDYGTWSLRDVLSYAIGYARRGIHYVPRIIATLNTVRPIVRGGVDDLRRALAAQRRPAAGQALRQPDARPRPGSACCARPRPPAMTASRRSRPRAAPGMAASSPRRSTASSAATRSSTPPAAATAAC